MKGGLTAVKRPVVAYNTHSGVKFYNFYRNPVIFNKKYKIYYFSLLLKVLYFVSKGPLNVHKYRRLLIGHVLELYTMKPVVENIAYSSL